MKEMRLTMPHQFAAVKNLGALATAIKAIAIVMSVLALFYQDLNIIFRDALETEATSSVLVIPFILGYLLYRKRKMINAVISIKEKLQTILSGGLLCATAIILYWYGSYTFTPLEYHIVSLSLFVAGLILVLFNSKTLKVLAFPIAFLMFLIPPPLQIVSEAGSILSTFSSEAAYNFLNVLKIPVTLVTEYETPLIILNRPDGQPFSFAVEISCSGIYSLIGFCLFAVFIAYIARGPTWKKATMLLAGFSFTYVLNVLRIIIIVSIGYLFGTEAAMQTFHLFGGWALVFLGTLALLFLAERLWKIRILTNVRTPSQPTHCPTCNPSTQSKEPFCPACGRPLKYTKLTYSKQDLVKIGALLLSIILIISVQVPAFALTEGPAEVLVQSPGGEQSATMKIFPQIPGYDLQFIYRDKTFEETAPREAALLYAYVPTNDSNTPVWVSLEVGNSKQVWHSWEASVIIWPQKLGRPLQAIQLDLRDIQLMQNPPIIGRFFAFDQVDSNTTQVVLYWYENAIFRTNMTSEEKYVKISVISYTNDLKNVHSTEEKLTPFGLAIANYWEPIKTWSQITLSISRNGGLLVSMIGAMLFGVFLSYALQCRKERKINYEAYQKLSRANRQVIETVYHTEKITTPTLTNISKTYQNATKETINEGLLHQKILEAEKAGIIRRNIVGKHDVPIQVWKTVLTFPKQKQGSKNAR